MKHTLNSLTEWFIFIIILSVVIFIFQLDTVESDMLWVSGWVITMVGIAIIVSNWRTDKIRVRTTRGKLVYAAALTLLLVPVINVATVTTAGIILMWENHSTTKHNSVTT